MRFDIRPHVPRRHGFILGYVALMGILVAALVFAYWQSFRHRNSQVRRAGDAMRARFLARSSLEHLRFAIREHLLRARPNVKPDVENGTFADMLLAPDATLRKAMAKRAPDGEDHRKFLEKALDPNAFETVDKMIKDNPEAKVTYSVVLKDVAPIGREQGLQDSVLKNVTLELHTEAKVRYATFELYQVESFRVYTALPEGSAKFTLAAIGVGEMNSLRTDIAGAPKEPQPNPIVLVHSPEDGDPTGNDPFAAPSDKKLERPGASDKVANAVDGMTGRGLVYVSPQNEVVLNLASGHAPLGEYFSLYNGGPKFYPEGDELEDQPSKLAGRTIQEPVLDPANSTATQQRPFVQGAALGLFESVNRDQILDDLPPPTVPARVSRLRLFGTPAMPSTTVIVGKVYRRLAAISDIAVDRDASGSDETDQKAFTASVTLPVREARDPFLANVPSEATYRSDLQAFDLGQPMAILKPFGSPGLLPGQLENRNLLVDLDGDLNPETTVGSEVSHQPILIDLSKYRYDQFFEGYTEYRRFMSKSLRIPANLQPFLASQPVAETTKQLLGLAFKETSSLQMNDYLLENIKVRHTDTLHTAADPGALYLDTSKVEPSQFEGLLSNGLDGTREIVVIRGQRAFEASFMSGTSLDLQGLEVWVYGEKPEDPSRLEFPRALTVARGGVLKVQTLIVTGIKHGAQGPEFEPLQVRTSSLVIRGAEPVEGSYRTPQILTEGAGALAFLRGNLVAEGPGALATSKPMFLLYDSRMDPTTDQAPGQYRSRATTYAAQYVVVEGSF